MHTEPYLAVSKAESSGSGASAARWHFAVNQPAAMLPFALQALPQPITARTYHVNGEGCAAPGWFTPAAVSIRFERDMCATPVAVPAGNRLPRQEAARARGGPHACISPTWLISSAFQCRPWSAARLQYCSRTRVNAGPLYPLADVPAHSTRPYSEMRHHRKQPYVSLPSGLCVEVVTIGSQTGRGGPAALGALPAQQHGHATEDRRGVSELQCCRPEFSYLQSQGRI